MRKWLAITCAVFLAGWLFVWGFSGDMFVKRTFRPDGRTVTQDYAGIVMSVVGLVLVVLFACYWWLSVGSTGRLWPWGIGARLIGDRVERWRERVSASGGYLAALRIALRARRKGLIASACFGFLGVLTYALLSHRLGTDLHLQVVLWGASLSLELVATAVLFGAYAGGALRHIVAACGWGLGMQVLWIPYLMMTWKRPFALAFRILLVGAACILMFLFNVLFFALSGAQAVFTM